MPEYLTIALPGEQNLRLRSGERIGTLRGRFSALPGCYNLKDHPLYVGEQRLEETHPVGLAPLVHGAHISCEPQALNHRYVALGSEYHYRATGGLNCAAMQVRPHHTGGRCKVPGGYFFTLSRVRYWPLSKRGYRTKTTSILTGRNIPLWALALMGGANHKHQISFVGPQNNYTYRLFNGEAPVFPQGRKFSLMMLAPLITGLGMLAFTQRLIYLLFMVPALLMVVFTLFSARNKTKQKNSEVEVALPLKVPPALTPLYVKHPGCFMETKARTPKELNTLVPPAPIAISGPGDQGANVVATSVLIQLKINPEQKLVVISRREKVHSWRWLDWVINSEFWLWESWRSAQLLENNTIVVAQITTSQDLLELKELHDHLNAQANSQGSRRDASVQGGRLIILLPQQVPAPAWCQDHYLIEGQSLLIRSMNQPERRHQIMSFAKEDLPWFAGQLPAPKDAWTMRGETLATHLERSIGLNPATVAAHWQTATNADLRVVIGQSANSDPFEVDLIKDGPHGLVAGTTGSGKSAFLQVLIQALAVKYSPQELNFALVDYKGGTSFGKCLDLPHVCGIVDDLDPASVDKALLGFQSELKRREALFKAHGYHEYAQVDRSLKIPRLVIIVDEFRALVDSHENFIPHLVRLAAQGRAFGIHLILATQRPAGAINADMRANLSLRVALRTLSEQDSQDVIGKRDAAHLPPQAPGSFYLTCENGQVEMGRTFCLTPEITAPPPKVLPANTFLRRLRPGVAEQEVVTQKDITEVVAQAAKRAGIRPASPLWSAPLPTSLSGAGVGFACVDDLKETREIAFNPQEAGNTVVVGPGSSGKTNTLVSIGYSISPSEYVLHCIGPADFLARFPAQLLGAQVLATDVDLVAQLLRRLRSVPENERHVVLVDGFDEVLERLETHFDAGIRELTWQLLKRTWNKNVTIVASCFSAPTSRYLKTFDSRLVLSQCGTTEQFTLGLSGKTQLAADAPAGRGKLFEGGTWLDIQIRLAQQHSPYFSDANAHVNAPSYRLLSLPRMVSIAQVRPLLSMTRPVIGLAGYNHTQARLPNETYLPVFGERASGKTNLLEVVARNFYPNALGNLPSLQSSLGEDGKQSSDGIENNFASQLEEWLTKIETCPGPSRRALFLDDLDQLSTRYPSEVLELENYLRENAQRHRIQIFASFTQSQNLLPARGLLGNFRNSLSGVVLRPKPGVSSDWLGFDLRPQMQASPGGPGRGLLISNQQATPLQVFLA